MVRICFVGPKLAYNSPTKISIASVDRFLPAGRITGRFTVRKLSGMMLMILMALLLAACGGNGGDEDAQPVGQTDDEAVEATIEPTATALAEEEEEESTPAAGAASPEAGGVMASPVSGATPAAAMASPVVAATPVAGMASPVAAASPVGAASPEAGAAMEGATPVASPNASPVASPMASTSASVAVVSLTGEGATQVASSTSMIMMHGTVELPGNVNQAYVLSDTGCVGLGVNADLQAGRQLVVRDESGTIIGVTTLEASDAGDTCMWTFSVDVPESEFYAVSIPMTMELVFTHEDIAESNGEVTIILP